MKSVLIIGGGVAGLSAARELARTGMRVTLLEAKSRLGGRIHTLHHGRLPIELGAEFIHGRSRPLLKAIKAARLSVRALPSLFHIWENDHLKPFDFWTKIEKVISCVNLGAPDRPFADFLKRQRLASCTYQLVRRFAEGFDAANVECLSAHSMLRAQHAAGEMHGDWQGRIVQGYGPFIDFLEHETEKQGGRLLRGAVVKEIHWGKGRVEVCFLRGRRQETLKAKAAIVTLPIGIWKAGTVKFHPALSDKQKAAREFGFGDVLKAMFLFRRRWWPRAGNGFIQALSEPLPTWWGHAGGPLLTGWVGGPPATQLLKLSKPRLETLCLETLSRIFSEPVRKLRKHLVALHTYNWRQDPDIRGAYSYIPVNGLDLPKILATPVENTLYFAGEATVLDAQTGTVFGAYESGLRAAHEVLSYTPKIAKRKRQ